MILGNVLIMGDSYSTFEGYNPEGYRLYYAPVPRPDTNTDVVKVEHTWWHQLLAKTNANLILNNSWSGSTIGYTGYNGDDNSQTCSFIYRLRQLIAEGFFEKNNIDTVLVFGGTNDNWCGAPLGEKKLSDWQEQELYCVLPAIYCYMELLRRTLPDAKIYSIINTEFKDEIIFALQDASRLNHIQSILLQDIHKVNGHPNILGMEQICTQVLSAME